MKSASKSAVKYLIQSQKRMKRQAEDIFVSFYLRKHRKLISKQKDEYHYMLLEGLKKYPNSLKLKRKLAVYEMEHDNHHEAAKYWKAIFKLEKRLDAEGYMMYSNVLCQIGDMEKAIQFLQIAEKEYLHCPSIKYLLLKMYAEISDKDQVVLYYEKWSQLLNHQDLPDSYKISFNIYEAYKKTRPLQQAETLLEKIEMKYPSKNDELKHEYVNLYIFHKDWVKAIKKLEKLKRDFEDEISLSMLYKITCQEERFKQVFNNALIMKRQEQNNEDLGYRKIILFDNGESRIEFYKKLTPVESVIITFDSINMTWDGPSFAYKLLAKENLDIIAVRKRQARTYQQDLNQEDFMKVVEPLLQGYKDKMAYGFSLGAYQTLYFASQLNCRILAIAPRLSIHPKFGRTKIIPKYKMKYDKNLPVNESIQPIIVYDPKNALDQNFIKNGVSPSFPNAKYVKIYYGGHGLAPFLRDTGQLKGFVYSFLNHETPIYNRKLKERPAVYYINLGLDCFKHNKLRWALSLANKCLKLEPKNKSAIELKTKTSKALNKHKETCGL